MAWFGRFVVVGVTAVALSTSPAVATSSGSRVVLQQSGDRSSTTEPFVVPRAWTLVWSYNCAKSPFTEGSFVVSVHPVSGTNVGPSQGHKIDEYGAKGFGRQSYTTSGRKTLVIVAQCPWKLKVLRTTI
jgi:hypothetical protein